MARGSSWSESETLGTSEQLLALGTAFLDYRRGGAGTRASPPGEGRAGSARPEDWLGFTGGRDGYPQPARRPSVRPRLGPRNGAVPAAWSHP